MHDLTVTLVQADLAWLDPEANRRRFAARLEALGECGTLVVLPEMFATGFTLEPDRCAEPMDGPTVAWMIATAARLGVTLCGSLAIRDAGCFYNRLLWVPPEGTVQWYDKRHLFRMAGEHERYSAGTARRVMTVAGWRVCPLVCYDLRFPVWSRGVDDFDLQLYVASWPAARRSAWRTLLPARAVENQCYAIGVNRVGTDGNGISYCGDSLAADPLGGLLADLGDGEGSATLRLDGDALVRYREKFPAWQDADRFRLQD